MGLLKLLENSIAEEIKLIKTSISFNTTIPIWHTLHSFKNKNRKDYNNSYDIDKRPIEDKELIWLFNQTLPTFIKKVHDGLIKENISYMINTKYSTVKIASYLEPIIKTEKLFDYLIRISTIRRNKLNTFPGQIIITEGPTYEQSLYKIISTLTIPITINVKYTKQFSDKSKIEELKKYIKLIEINQIQIVRWLKNNVPRNGSKIDIPINENIFTCYLEKINPFEYLIKINNIT